MSVTFYCPDSPASLDEPDEDDVFGSMGIAGPVIQVSSSNAMMLLDFMGLHHLSVEHGELSPEVAPEALRSVIRFANVESARAARVTPTTVERGSMGATGVFIGNGPERIAHYLASLQTLLTHAIDNNITIVWG